MAAVPSLAACQPSAKAKAIGAPIEMDISKLKPGQRIIGKWQGMSVWVVHRTKEAVDNLGALNQRLRDPNSREEQQPTYARNIHCSRKPEVCVVIGLCTHFGCSPQHLPFGEFNPEVKDREGGFFCPCHGSRFDMAGRGADQSCRAAPPISYRH
jgi:ubiquinol-cytochrome c reductase iron-sulfur subunit